MNFKMIIKSCIRYFVGCLVSVSLVGCAAATPEAPTPEPTPIPEDTSDASPPPIEITWDGNECIVSGPSEVPTGQYLFIWNNLSDEPAVEFWVSQILDGKTYQDVLDLQDEPGDYVPKPSFISNAPGYFDNDDEVWRIMLGESGDYYIVLGHKHWMWHCVPLQVFEAP